MSSQALVSLLRNCTVRIPKGDTGYGTGFFVAPGKIVTCAHVVGSQTRKHIEVYWNDTKLDTTLTKLLPGTVSKGQSVWPDLALLATDYKEHECVMLAPVFRTGDPLFLFGYSDHHSNGDSVSASIEGISIAPELLKFKQGQVRGGMSGSPLLNLRTGGVCGVVKSSRNTSSDLGGRAIMSRQLYEEFPEVLEEHDAYHSENAIWLRAMEANLPKTVYQGELEVLGPSILVTGATNSFFRGSEPTWSDIVMSNDFRRDFEDKILESLKSKRDRPSLHLVSGVPGSGKSTLLRRIGYTLYSRGESVWFHLRSAKGLSTGVLRELTDSLDRPIYLLIDDIFRRLDTNSLLADVIDLNLPIHIIATSRTNEVERVRVNIQSYAGANEYELDSLSQEEVGRLIGKLEEKGQTNWPSTTTGLIRSSVTTSDSLLTFMLRLDSARLLAGQSLGFADFRSILRDELESVLRSFNGRLLHASYTYICALYSLGVMTPISMLIKLVGTDTVYRDVLSRVEAEGLIVRGDNDLFRARHELVAEGVTEITWPDLKQVEGIYREIISKCDPLLYDERMTVLSLLANLVTRGREDTTLKLLSEAPESLLERILKHATLSELLDGWCHLFEVLNLLELQRAAFDLALNANPDDTQTLVRYARFLSRLGDPLAEDHFRSAYSLESDEPSVVNNYTEYLIQQRRFEEAVEILDQMLAAGVRNSHVLITYASLLIGQGHYAEAESFYQAAIEIDPTDTYALVEFSRYNWNQGRSEKALLVLEKAVATNPQSSKAVRLYANYCTRLTLRDRAVSYIEELLEENPTNRSLRQELISLRLSLGDTDRALEQTRILHLNYPRDRGGQRQYVKLLESNQRLEEAYERLLKFLEYAPGTIHDYLRLFRLSSRLGKPTPPESLLSAFQYLLHQRLISGLSSASLPMVPYVELDEAVLAANMKDQKEEMVPRLLYARRLADNDQEESVRDLLLRSNKNTVDAVIETGFMIGFLLSRGNQLEAKHLLAELMAADFVPLWAYTTLLQLINREANRDEFERQTDAMIRQYPGYVPAALSQIDLLLADDRATEADQRFRELVRDHPFDFSLRRKYITFLMNTANDHERAESHLVYLLHHQPHDTYFRQLLVDIYRKRGASEDLDNQVRFLTHAGLPPRQLPERLRADIVPLPKQIEALTDAIQKNPASVRLVYEYVALLEREGSHDKARIAIESAINREVPPRASLRRLYARFLADRGDLEGAATEYKLAIEEHPDKPKNYTSFAAFLDRIGNTPEAVSVLRSGMRIAGLRLESKYLTAQANAAHRLGRIDEADTFHRLSILADPRDSVSYLNFAVFLTDIGDPEGAEEQFKRCVAVRPDYVIARQAYAVLLSQMSGRVEEASEIFEELTQFDPYNVPVMSAYASHLIKHRPHNWEGKAEELLKQAVSQEGNHVQSRLAYASLLEMQRRYKEAEQQLRAAVATENPYVSRQVYGVFLKNRGNFDAAEAMLASAVDPRVELFASRLHNAMVHNAIADLLIKRAAPVDEILENFERSLDIEGDNDQARFHLLLSHKKYAEYLCQTRDLISAREHFEAAIKIDPRNEYVRNSYARCLEGMGRHGEALAQYEAMLKQYPTNPHALNGAATILCSMRRYDQAQKYFERCIANEPRNTYCLRSYAYMLIELGQFGKAGEIIDRIEEAGKHEIANRLRLKLPDARL